MAASETTGLLAGSAAGATPSSREAAKDQYVVRAVEHLHVILYVVAWTAVAVFVVLFVNEFVDHAVPVWAVFLVVWVGHVGVLVVAGSSVHLVLESMSTGDSGSGQNHDGDDERTTAQWHQINERRIPLVQYLMYNLAWVLWVSLILVVFEVLLYVGLTGDTPLTACLVPVYVAGGLAVFTAVLCRSAALSVTVTWLLLLATAILVNVKLDDPDRLAWSDTVIPSYALVAYWLLLCLYTLVLHAVDVYRLKTYQLEIVTLYIAALGLFLVAIVGVDGYLGGAQVCTLVSRICCVHVPLVCCVLCVDSQPRLPCPSTCRTPPCPVAWPWCTRRCSWARCFSSSPWPSTLTPAWLPWSSAWGPRNPSNSCPRRTLVVGGPWQKQRFTIRRCWSATSTST